ncbi:MAG: DUF4349 domain-containing protein [Solirubrobacteraceae bacterium]|nr:DUF4349 domain-containing protein [Solirubrobacteraceae bacterium]
MLMIRSDQTPESGAPLDPKVIAELDQLDAALRGEAVTDEALAQLVRDVQAQAPEMPTALRTQLNEDVAAGFPRFGKAGADRAERRPTATKAPRVGWRVFGGMAAVATVCCVMVVGLATMDGDDSYTTSSESLPELAAARPSGPSDSASPQSADPAAPDLERSSRDGSTGSGSSGAAAPSELDQASGALDSATTQKLKPSTATPASGRRRVEQSVEMSVRVKSGGLDEAAGKVGDITRRAGGFVADSEVSMRTRGAGSATFTLQVASSKLDAAIGSLSDLGTVTRQDQQSVDITSSFDTANQRLGDAKAVRKALLRSLDKADSAGAIAALRTRIADNRKTIAGLESEILQLDRRTNLTTIGLSLNAPSGDAPSGDDDGRWTIGDALGDAGSVLGTVGGVLIVAIAVLLPFALIGGLGWSVYLVRRKRARDGALD